MGDEHGEISETAGYMNQWCMGVVSPRREAVIDETRAEEEQAEETDKKVVRKWYRL